MAPVFKHGKGTRALVGGIDLALYTNNADEDNTVDVADVTTYKTSTGGQTHDRRYVPGHRDSVITFDGLMDGSTGPTAASGGLGVYGTERGIEAALGGSVQPVLTWGAVGDAVGDYANLALVDASGYKVTSPGKDVVATTISLQASMRRGGRWLHTLAAETSTAAQSGVTLGSTAAASTRGGVAHLHVVGCSTLTTLTVKVQHSSDGASWADLITLSATAATAVRSTVAGTVKERVRAASTVLSGGAGKTVTYAVAFARHPSLQQ